MHIVLGDILKHNIYCSSILAYYVQNNKLCLFM